MAQLLVRKIDESLKEQLRAQAKSKGRSLEEEARAILKGSVEVPAPAASELGWATKLVERRKSGGLSNEEFAEFERAIESTRRAPVDVARDLLVRNLEHPLKERLQARAREHGRSVEEEARQILKDAIEPLVGRAEQYGLGTRIHALFKDIGLSDEEAALFDGPGRPARAADFD